MKGNDIIIKDDYAELIIRNRINEIAGIALIDIDDIDKVKNYTFHLYINKKLKYVKTKYKGKSISLHRIIMNVLDCADIVDHIYGDGLDNRKSKLRLVTQSVNLHNRHNTIPKNYYFCPKYKKYRVRMTLNKRSFVTGYFDTVEEVIIEAAYYKNLYISQRLI